MTTLSKLAALLLGATMFSLVGCAADAGDADDLDEQEEEMGSTESEVKASKGAQVAAYARKNYCEISGNHIVQLECPIATDKKVFKYAQEKLGKKKAYRCGAAYYICLDY